MSLGYVFGVFSPSFRPFPEEEILDNIVHNSIIRVFMLVVFEQMLECIQVVSQVVCFIFKS